MATAKNLIIVESPAKAKTISRFVGNNFVVTASMGHVRDLPKSALGVDVKEEFEPTYRIMPDKRKIIADLQSKIGDSTTIWIATDEDREGEAIGWHLMKALKLEDGDPRIKRIVFHEITKPAILHALENPRQIHPHLVDAQQARRVLDRLVGYELSPLLWKKVRYGLSAGRVQSVAVRLIVEREREIKAFTTEEYWTITAQYIKDGKNFEGLLQKVEGKKPKIDTETKATEILKALHGKKHTVTEVSRKRINRYPAPPFITSTLQQEAARKLGFSVKKTMMIAQQLYEGLMIDGESTALITYMRTDSVNLSNEALNKAQEVIRDYFGSEYTLQAPRRYKSKKGAQEAHEAIRPVDLSILPASLKNRIESAHYKLYELIWKRTIASQMKEADLEQVGADIQANEKFEFRATGQTVVFPGFMRAYTESFDHPDEEAQNQEKILPELSSGELLDVREILPAQHFTKPPPRYTEASLVKKLESEGIGRPSTYAPTISTIITRGYVVREQKQLKPTDVGEVVNDILVKHFADIVDYKFTAKMEEELDAIADGKIKWRPLIASFYGPFHKNLELKQQTLNKEDLITEKTNEVCEKCAKPMEIKLGRFGKFLSCTGYPECKNARPIDDGSPAAHERSEEHKALAKKFAEKKCDKCKEPMEVKNGRYGFFLGCSAYPKCKNIKPIIHFTGIKCGACKEGQYVERRTRKGARIFWGCNRFPKCHSATWHKPVRNSDECESGVMVMNEKEGKEECMVIKTTKK